MDGRWKLDWRLVWRCEVDAMHIEMQIVRVTEEELDSRFEVEPHSAKVTQ